MISELCIRLREIKSVGSAQDWKKKKKNQLQCVISEAPKNPNTIRIKAVGCHKAPFTVLIFFHNYVNDRRGAKPECRNI